MKYENIVTVIIPTYNYGHYIKHAIDSVLECDFPQNEIEIIIIDDGSTDNTCEIINSNYNQRVKYIYQQNSGKAWATKVGIDNSSGKYIFNLDADDLFLPHKIKSVVAIFESDPAIVHVAHPALYWQINNPEKSPEAIPEILFGNKFDGKELLLFFYRNRILFGGGSTFAARRETLSRFSIPRQVDMYIDEYLVMCTLNQGYSYFLEDPLSIWRIHGGNYSGSERMSEKYQTKMIRSLKSMEGILNHLHDFDDDIRRLYALKLRLSEIAYKEDIGNKKVSDILLMWSFFVQNFNIFSPQSLTIIKSYWLINRTLPTFVLTWLRILKYQKGKS
jgi:glycosyltransferase involved in cell wall biosynthesis